MVKWYGEHTLVNRHVVLVFGSQVQYNVRNAPFWLPTPFLAKVLSKHPFLKTKGTNSKRKLLGFIQFTWNRSVMVQYLYMMNFCRTFSTMFLKNSWPCASGPKFIDAGVFALFFPALRADGGVHQSSWQKFQTSWDGMKIFFVHQISAIWML